jgi:hypothetical protein
MSGQAKGDFTCITTDQTGFMIVCGTSLGEILECDTQAMKVYKYNMGSDVITTVELSLDKRFIAAGNSCGQIMYKRTNNKWGSKVVTDRHKRPIVAVRFTEAGEVLVITDSSLQKIRYIYYKLYIEHQIFEILTEARNLSQIEVAYFEGYEVVTVASLEEVHILSTKPKLEIMLTLKRPDYVQESVPCVSWCKSGDISEEKSILCIIFWHKF